MQEFIDNYKEKTELKLILLGSAIGMVDKMFSYSGALYGRRTANITLRQLSFFDSVFFFPAQPLDEIIRFYGMSGGTPGYLEVFARYDSAKDAARALFFSPSGEFREEPFDIIRSELGPSPVYFSILRALAEGRTRFSEIASRVNIKVNTLDYYLHNLQNIMDVVSQVVPALTKGKRLRPQYELRDNFFRFWFTFVYPWLSMPPEDGEKMMVENFARYYNMYLGHVFEHVAREFLQTKYRYVAPWWHKGEEIDLIAREKNTLVLFEVKWGEPSKADVRAILDRLGRLGERFKGEWDVRLGLVCRKLQNKEDLWAEGVEAYDLHDIEKEVKRRSASVAEHN